MAERYRMKLNDNEENKKYEDMDNHDKEWYAKYGEDLNILNKLSEDSKSWIREDLAKRPTCPTEILIKLANDENEDVRRAVASNKKSTNEALEIVYNKDNKDYWSYIEIVKRKKASPELLRKIFEEHKDEHWLREELAHNPSSPVDLLEELASVGYKEAKTRLKSGSKSVKTSKFTSEQLGFLQHNLNLDINKYTSDKELLKDVETIFKDKLAELNNLGIADFRNSSKNLVSDLNILSQIAKKLKSKKD